MPQARSPAQIVCDRLAAYLGPHTAQNAVKTFSARAVGVVPEQLTRADAPKLLEALRPMLRTLLGAAQTDTVLKLLERELAI